MGRKNKSYSKDLHQQAYEKLTSMLALGESKREAVLNGTADDKIFSVNTYKTYWKHIKYFLKYVKEKYPECTTLKKAKRYVNEWLQVRVDQDLSAWTIQAEAKALGKSVVGCMFQCKILRYDRNKKALPKQCFFAEAEPVRNQTEPGRRQAGSAFLGS